jgi:hypothetical protein
MKVVPHIPIYHQKHFHNFLRSLSIFLELLDLCVEWKMLSEKKKINSLHGLDPPTGPNP